MMTTTNIPLSPEGSKPIIDNGVVRDFGWSVRSVDLAAGMPRRDSAVALDSVSVAASHRTCASC